MDPVNITYRIKLSEQVTEVFDYTLDGNTFELVKKNIPNPPAWTELGFKQCSHCPLKAEEHKHCPMALQLHDVVQRFHKTSSIDEVELEVITEQRRVIKVTALQNAISSMLGLLFPTCGCPKTAYMKPLARFHVPMASEEETVFHVAGMYLLAQFLLNSNGKKGSFSFDGLTEIYNDLHILNKAVASRLQAVTSSDSVKNAITLIDMYSSLVPILLQDQLSEIRGFFRAYLPEGEAIVPTSNYLEQAKAFKLELIPTDEELELQLAENADQEEEEEDEAVKALPEWLRKSLPKDKPPMPKFKPEVKPLQGTEPSRPPVPPAPPPERKKAVFFIPDDDFPPKAGEDALAAKPAEPKEEDDGGLKMIDFEP